MDKNVFDTVVRGFAPRRSRRDALKGLAAAALGLGVVREASAQPGAQRATCGQRCNKDDDCNAGLRCGTGSNRCYRKPHSKTRCGSNIQCTNNWEICNKNDRCINGLQRNCDECGRNGDCPSGQKCRNGACQAPQCSSNKDCNGKKKCRKGRCVKPNK